jgi:outer membrane protein TolC
MCFSFLLGGSQGPVLTLDQAIDLALKNDFSHRISQKQVEVYRHRLKDIGLLPQITLDGYKNLDEKLQVIEIPSFTGGEPQKVTLDFTRNYEFTLQVLQPVFTGGKAYFGFKNALLDLKDSREALENSREETILRVRKGFYNILVMREYHRVQQEALGLAEKNYQNLRQSHELGLVSQYDLLRAELAVSTLVPEVSRARNLYEISILNLKNILQMGEDVEPQITGELALPPFNGILDELRTLGVQNRFELRQLAREQEKAANLLKIAYGQYLPQIALVARYSYRSDLFNFRSGNWEDNYSINLAVSLPIFPGMSRNARIGEIRVSRKILELNREMLTAATRLEVESRYKTILQEFEAASMAQKNLELAREGLRIAELNHQEGLISLLDLNMSTTDLTRARVALLQAYYNCNIQVAELEKLVGIRYQGGVK